MTMLKLRCDQIGLPENKTADVPVADAGFLEGGSVIITRAKRARNF